MFMNQDRHSLHNYTLKVHPHGLVSHDLLFLPPLSAVV